MGQPSARANVPGFSIGRCANGVGISPAVRSWTWMTVAVVAEISAAVRIIRPEPPQAVGDRIPRSRPVVTRRSVIAVIGTGAVIVGSREHSAYDRTTE